MPKMRIIMCKWACYRHKIKKNVIAVGQMDGNKDLRALALKHLGAKDLDGLLEWYDECIKADARYVVFVVRRSYILSLILESLTGRSMTDGLGKTYVTDSAFLLCCEELANYYEAHSSFPKIMLCDDLLIHGRNLNRVIEAAEDRLQELLPKEDKDVICEAFSDAIQIRVYCLASNDHLLLRTEYMQDAECVIKYEPIKWRELSSHISSLIVESGIANATYVASEVISKEECERVIESDAGYQRWIFQNVEGYIKVDFLCDEREGVCAIYTIRLLKNKLNDSYRVIPFVFMPNLDNLETLFLFNCIKQLGLENGYSELFFERLKDLYSINGKRAYNEWVTLIICQAVLQEFNRRYNIKTDDFICGGSYKSEYYREIVKLSRNYRFDSTDSHIVFLETCIKEKPIFSDMEKLSDILRQCGFNRRIIILGDQSIDKRQIRSIFENYFYEQGYEEELDAVRYRGEPSMQRGVSRRSVRGCCFIFKELLSQVSLESARYGVSIFLLMMDAGVLALSSHPAREINVVGYAQFAKAGEQSLLLRPLRYMEYIPFLSIAYDWCKQFNRDFIEHLAILKETKFCDIPSRIMDKLISFIEDIDFIEEKIVDWNGSYYEKIDFGFETSSQEDDIDKQYKLEQSKNKHVENYKEYMLELTRDIYT